MTALHYLLLTAAALGACIIPLGIGLVIVRLALRGVSDVTVNEDTL